MSGDRQGPKDYVVGYGKPPKSGQFRKGLSGNPLGRPRKSKPAKPQLPAIQPTREILERVAEKSVVIREGDQRQVVTGTEAVVQALMYTGMKGGVLAGRTFLQYQLEIDDRNEQRKRERFEFWRECVRKDRLRIAEAQRNGLPPPEIYPHPDDVEFDYLDLEVKFVGPMNKAEADKAERNLKETNLFWEILLYHSLQNDFGIVIDGRYINAIQMAYEACIILSPKRYRTMHNEYVKSDKWFRSLRGRHSECIYKMADELNMRFKLKKPIVVDLAEVGLIMRNGQAVPHKWTPEQLQASERK